MPGFQIPSSGGDSCGPTGQGSPSHTVESGRRHRYLVQILDPLKDILVYAYKCTRPNIEFDEIAIHNAQDEIFRPGKQHWKPIDFTFYEVVSGSFDNAAKLIYEWWAKTMVNVETSLHNPPSTYLKKAQLDMLDGNGDTIWSYYIYDTWPAKVSPSDLGYVETEISEIAVSLRYAKAREQYKASSAGSATSSLSSGSSSSTLRGG